MKEIMDTMENSLQKSNTDEVRLAYKGGSQVDIRSQFFEPEAIFSKNIRPQNDDKDSERKDIPTFFD